MFTNHLIVCRTVFPNFYPFAFVQFLFSVWSLVGVYALSFIVWDLFHFLTPISLGVFHIHRIAFTTLINSVCIFKSDTSRKFFFCSLSFHICDNFRTWFNNHMDSISNFTCLFATRSYICRSVHLYSKWEREWAKQESCIFLMNSGCFVSL